MKTISSSFGKSIKVTISGGSHEPLIRLLLTGIPRGEKVSFSEICKVLEKRAGRKKRAEEPFCDDFSTSRKEMDVPEFISGFTIDGDVLTATGDPIEAILYNKDVRPGDYDKFRDVPRPGHADYTGYLRYGGEVLMSGGGPFSARMTAPLCVAGSIAQQVLARRGIHIGAHILSAAGIESRRFTDEELGAGASLAANASTGAGSLADTSTDTGAGASLAAPPVFARLAASDFPVLCAAASEGMRAKVRSLRSHGDTAGGVIEVAACGVPAGIGGAMYDGLEGRLSYILLGVPSVKGVDFGAGFEATSSTGSAQNDCFYAAPMPSATPAHGTAPAQSQHSTDLAFAQPLSQLSPDHADSTISPALAPLETDELARPLTGAGFEAASSTGSAQNDCFYAAPMPSAAPAHGTAPAQSQHSTDLAFAQPLSQLSPDHADSSGFAVRTRTNNHGGILGGVSTGMPITARVAFKPIPSIALPQQTLNLARHTTEELRITGRHDTFVLPRAVPIVTSAMALAICDCLFEVENEKKLACESLSPVGSDKTTLATPEHDAKPLSLAEARAEIDIINAEIIALFNKRMHLSAQIAKEKQKNASPILDEDREALLLKNARTLASDGLEDYAEILCKTLMELSRDYQSKLLEGGSSPCPYTSFDFLQGKNLVLIGMPGSGKTTFGKILATILDRPFIDLDKKIEEFAQMSIPRLFEEYGEKHFRDLEEKVSFDVSQRKNTVIATGGGTVLREKNMLALGKDNIVIFLDTPLDMLKTEGRPLSSSREALEKLYAERISLYEKYANVRISTLRK